MRPRAKSALSAPGGTAVAPLPSRPRTSRPRSLSMNIKYVFGPACALTPAAAVAAQAQPTPPAPKTMTPIGQPAPKSPTPITVAPIGLQGMGYAGQPLYPIPGQFAWLNTPTAQAQYQYQEAYSRLNTMQDALNMLTSQVQAQSEAYARLNAMQDADRLARLGELNQQYMGDLSQGAQSLFNDTQGGRYQQPNYQYNGFNTFYVPDVQPR